MAALAHQGGSRPSLSPLPVNAALLGTPACGKSALAIKFALDTFPQSYTPTIEDSFARVLQIGSSEVHLTITDTSGQLVSVDALDDVGRLSIPETEFDSTAFDVFILVFSVDDNDSFRQIRAIWDAILSRSADQTPPPVILVGTKSDLKPVVDLDTANDLAYELGDAAVRVSPTTAFIVSAKSSSHADVAAPFVAAATAVLSSAPPAGPLATTRSDSVASPLVAVPLPTALPALPAPPAPPGGAVAASPWISGAVGVGVPPPPSSLPTASKALPAASPPHSPPPAPPASSLPSHFETPAVTVTDSGDTPGTVRLLKASKKPLRPPSVASDDSASTAPTAPTTTREAKDGRRPRVDSVTVEETAAAGGEGGSSSKPGVEDATPPGAAGKKSAVKKGKGVKGKKRRGGASEMVDDDEDGSDAVAAPPTTKRVRLMGIDDDNEKEDPIHATLPHSQGMGSNYDPSQHQRSLLQRLCPCFG